MADVDLGCFESICSCKVGGLVVHINGYNIIKLKYLI